MSQQPNETHITFMEGRDGLGVLFCPRAWIATHAMKETINSVACQNKSSKECCTVHHGVEPLIEMSVGQATRQRFRELSFKGKGKTGNEILYLAS